MVVSNEGVVGDLLMSDWFIRTVSMIEFTTLAQESLLCIQSRIDQIPRMLL